MFSKKILFSLVACSTLLAGCTQYINATVLPHGNNKYSVVALSSSEDSATHNAMDKATQVCSEKGMQVNVIKQECNYRGADQQSKMLTGIAGGVLSALSHGGAGVSSGRNHDDYKVTMDFACQ